MAFLRAKEIVGKSSGTMIVLLWALTVELAIETKETSNKSDSKDMKILFLLPIFYD